VRRAGRDSAVKVALNATRGGLLPACGLKKAMIASSPRAMRIAVPKKGARQLTSPSAPPTSGPTAIPTPSAASYRMMALPVLPLAADTMVASAVEMNRALPRPHPARNPMIWLTVSEEPASAANTTMRPSPASSVRFAPRRDDTQLVKNIATPVMNR